MTKGRTVFKRIVIFSIAIIVLFVALSTATYAWYTTTNSVKAGDITFTSSASDASGAITIGKTTTTNDTTLTFDKTNRISPMIPAYQAVIGTTNIDDFRRFQTTYEELNDLGYPIAALAGVNTEPYGPTVDGQKHFYINNKSDSSVTLGVAYTIEGALANKLHVALFSAPASGGAFIFRGIMTNAENVHYGIIGIGEEVKKTATMNETIVSSGYMSLAIPANASISVKLLVWLDGVDMHNEDGGRETSFSLEFVS